METTYIIKGTAFHSLQPGEITILQDHLFIINETGFIEHCISPNEEMHEKIIEQHKGSAHFYELKEGQFLLPGFIDTHVHAPQWAQAGKALHVDLPTWLNQYTFPLEAAYEKETFAQPIYDDVVDTLLVNGTTTALYFGTVHNRPNEILAETCARKGQRGFIGKVVMDEPSQCPNYYCDQSAQQALIDSESFLQYAKELSTKTKQGVYGVLTPRFIPTCTDEVLYGLGALAKQYDAPIQSHCSEGDWEHAYVLERTGKRDTEALLEYGLLTDKTVLAHCVFLNDNDAALFRETGAAIAHSPVSNVLFANAIAPIRKRLEQGVTVGLATDISGGYSPSMFDAMRQSILSSRTLEDGVHITLPPHERGLSHSRMDFRHAFYMATTGGAKALNLKTGSFQKDFIFDAFIFDVHAPHSNIRMYNQDTLEDMLQKIIFLGQRQNITSLWVQGQKIF